MFNFEVGQVWKTRGGDFATIDRVEEPSLHQFYSVFGTIDTGSSESWTEVGAARLNDTSNNDLVELMAGSKRESGDSRDYFVEIMSKPVRGLW